MSTQAAPEPEGLSGVAPETPGDAQRSPLRATRPALQALPRLRRRHRGLVGGVIGLMVTALIAVLAINVHISTTQYRVVELSEQRQQLVQQNEALAQQVQHLESPQVLSDSAVSLGMVMPARSGAFDLQSGAVVGSAEAADSGDRPSSFVPAPTVPGQEGTAPMDVSEEAAAAPSGPLGAGALDALARSSTPPPESGAAGEDDQQFSADRLDGGTVPAPSLD